MITYGFARGHLETDLAIASKLRADCVEILPDWRNLPEPDKLRARVVDAGFDVHSAHGCWGGQAIRARRVDIADPDESARRDGVDDLRRCLDWLNTAGGKHLIVHPGGLSDEPSRAGRRDALAKSLLELADHARGHSLYVCVENMPPGVVPGSHMSDLEALLGELERAELALALDTGHANLVSSVVEETRGSSKYLRSTHVHDNNGKADSHWPPGTGTCDWGRWLRALDDLDYQGPIMLECIQHLREHPESIDDRLMAMLDSLTRREPA
jgi:sugar phosphate isomerase/epimerase